MCYFTSCKNNRHKHSPTLKFVTPSKKSSSLIRPPVTSRDPPHPASTNQTLHQHRQCSSSSLCFLVCSVPDEARNVCPSTAWGGTGPSCSQDVCCLFLNDPNMKSAASPERCSLAARWIWQGLRLAVCLLQPRQSDGV